MKLQEGYLTKASGSWLGHYSRWITDFSTGQRKRQQRAFKIGPVSSLTKTQAKEKLRQRVVSDLGITADSRVTLAWFVQNRWLPLHEGSWRESTRGVNLRLLKIVMNRFGDTPVEDLDAVAMQGWLAELAKKKSGSLVKHSRVFLRSIMSEAFEQEYVRKNPARLLKVPKLKTVVRPYLTVEEVTALIEAAKWHPRERTLLSVILVTGFRPSELFALRWKCFDAKASTIKISETVYRGELRPYTKTTEENATENLTVFLPEPALIALLKWHTETKDNSPDAFIFPNNDGGLVIVENYLKRVLTPLAKRAKVPHVNFQILRRTVAMHAQDLGSPKDISAILRHREVETAQKHYVQVVEASVKATTEALATKLLKQ